MEPLVHGRFPGVTFHDHTDAMEARAPASGRFDPVALDGPLLEKLAMVESQALRMMDRIDYAGVRSLTERRETYYEHVRYWSAVLDAYRPDILFNPATPHQIYDFVLQELCRLRGIRTIMFGLGFDLHRIFCKEDYTEGAGTIGPVYAARVRTALPEHIELSPDIEVRFERITKSYDEAIPKFLVQQIKDERRQPGPLGIRSVAKALLHAVRDGSRLLANGLSRNPARWRKAEIAAQQMSEHFYVNLVGPLRLASIRGYYEKLATEADLGGNYIYLPLAYQPEQSSSPEGGVFVEQLLIVDLLSKCLPAGWTILVKEHPSQFTFLMGTNRAARSHKFYDDLLARMNVRLLPLKTNPFALIDNARAVATVTGTSGWEALVRGKPVLHFGFPWWQGCEGAFYTPDVQSCRRVLQLINAGFRVAPEKVRLFAKVAEEESCSGDIFWDRTIQPLTAADNPRVAEVVRDMARLIARVDQTAVRTRGPCL